MLYLKNLIQKSLKSLLSVTKQKRNIESKPYQLAGSTPARAISNRRRPQNAGRATGRRSREMKNITKKLKRYNQRYHYTESWDIGSGIVLKPEGIFCCELPAEIIEKGTQIFVVLPY
jgi:hypothetical protein